MDDDEKVREVTGILLQRMGHEVELVADGWKAIEAFETAQRDGRPFDAVLLDLTVRAGVGGRETINALIKINPAVKAIIMSGYGNDPAVVSPECYGFKGGIAKPFDIEEMRNLLSRVLENESDGNAEP